MSFVVRSNMKSRRGRGDMKDDYVKDVRRTKPKNKPRNRDLQEERQPIPLKVVVRNLPSQFSKELFLQHVSPIPDYTYFAFHGPDHTLANHARCRVYIRFRTENDVGIFKDKFDGYVFVDNRGHELRCVVEIAPYQRTADQNREKCDPKCGQILESDEYKKFLEDLEKKKDHPPSSSTARVQANLAAIENKAKEEPGLTPLMEYLQNHKPEDDFRRSGGRRFGAPSRKEKFRDRQRRNPPPPPPPPPPISASKKDIPPSDKMGFKGVIPSPKHQGSGRVMELSKPKAEQTSSEQYRPNVKLVAARPMAPLSEPPKPMPGTPPARRAGETEFQPSADRGRHFFAERTTPRPQNDRRDELASGGRFRDQRQENYPDDNRRNDTYQGRGDRPDLYPPRGGNQAYGGGGNRGGGNRGHQQDYQPSDRGDRPAVMTKPINNPITGSREFAQNRSTTTPVAKPADNNVAQVVEKVVVAKPTEEASSAATAPIETGVRVPNRSRPTKELYQPKAKRRFQN